MGLVSLRNSREFHAVYKRGRSVVTKYIVMYYKKNDLDENRVGISVSKKVGKAVVRNRVKRLIKETFRLRADSIEKGYDIVFVARVRMNRATFKDTSREMNRVLKELQKRNQV